MPRAAFPFLWLAALGCGGSHERRPWDAGSDAAVALLDAPRPDGAGFDASAVRLDAGSLDAAADAGGLGPRDAGTDTPPRPEVPDAPDRQEAVLTARDGAPEDWFGFAVALSADGTRALVGAYLDDTVRGENVGTVRVFVRTGTTWAAEATLAASDGAPADFFGRAVALSADGSRALVGVYDDDVGGLAPGGSARVLSRTGSIWTEEATLRASDVDTRDFLGWSVALSADGDRALLGAPADLSADGVRTGSARVFSRSGTSWSEEAVLLAPDGAERDHFGESVALDAAGRRAVVGAWFDDTIAGVDAGSVRVFFRDGSTWTEEAAIFPSGETPVFFGRSVALSGDGTRIVTAATFVDEPRVFVFGRVGTTWVEEAMLHPPVGVGLTNWFGVPSVLDHDGDHAVVGMSDDDRTTGPGGSAIVYVRSGTTWSERDTLRAPDVEPADWFGRALAIDRDGRRALIGAFRDNTTAGTDTGTARVFVLEP